MATFTPTPTTIGSFTSQTPAPSVPAFSTRPSSTGGFVALPAITDDRYGLLGGSYGAIGYSYGGRSNIKTFSSQSPTIGSFTPRA